MLWNRETIPESANVLQIEELITTSFTVNKVKEAIEKENQFPVNFVPVIGVLVHRPPELPITHYGDREVVFLIEKRVWAVDQEECGLCKKGSKRYKPKDNWAKLTGKE